jgi:hypothetical protein
MVEQNPEQQLVGQFALWIDEVQPNQVYWTLLMCKYGIYDKEQQEIKNLLDKSKTSGLTNLMETRTYLEAVLDFILWLYKEDRDLCFELMKYVYQDFENREDHPEPYESLHQLESFEEGDTFEGIEEPELQLSRTKVVEEGSEFDFYRELSSHTQAAKDEIFIIDSYVDEEAIELYLADVDESISKKILTINTSGKFDQVARKFVKRSDDSVEVRLHNDVHDRIVFVDNQCFLIGNSIKDAGHRRPTYIVETMSTEPFREPWDEMWGEAGEYDID